MIEQKDKLVATRATRIVIALTAVTCVGAVVAAAPIGLTTAVHAAKPKIERTGFRPLAYGPTLQVGKQFGPDDEDCILKVTRVQGPDGRVYVTRGSTCGE
jgi:hypothetical protein